MNARQAGLTLVELMVSITLGLLVVMSATALLVSSKTAYTSQGEGALIQDTARYAIEIITRAVRQTQYENWDKDDAPMTTTDIMSANVVGLDANSLKDTSIGIESPLGTSVNGSDVLAVRFFGAGAKPAAGADVDGFGKDGYGSIINCAGFGVEAPSSPGTAEEDRGWSIFYVANDTNGEPQLRCKYYGNSSWSSEAIASGVESFQVLYGVDADADGLPNQFLTAKAINALDVALVLEGADDAAKAEDKNRKTYWKKVTVIKVALLVRGSATNGGAGVTCTGTTKICFDLFGADYGNDNGSTDSGTRFKESDLPVGTLNRARKVYLSTIQLRNQGS